MNNKKSPLVNLKAKQQKQEIIRVYLDVIGNNNNISIEKITKLLHKGYNITEKDVLDYFSAQKKNNHKIVAIA